MLDAAERRLEAEKTTSASGNILAVHSYYPLPRAAVKSKFKFKHLLNRPLRLYLSKAFVGSHAHQPHNRTLRQPHDPSISSPAPPQPTPQKELGWLLLFTQDARNPARLSSALSGGICMIWTAAVASMDASDVAPAVDRPAAFPHLLLVHLLMACPSQCLCNFIKNLYVGSCRDS